MNTQESIKILDQLMRSEELHYDTEATDALHHAIEHLSQTLPAVEQEARFAQRGAPEGWKLVPKEPTHDIIDEGVEACWDKFTWAENVDNSDLKDLCKKVYKYMLSAAPEPPQYTRGQWQPIETAPKDGTGVLLCISIGDGHHVQYTGSYHDGHWWVTNFSGEDEYWYTPTDWRPLDEPPQESTTKLPFQAEPRKN